ncbi:MAG: hypothetical protein Kow00105_05730 [Phycisphaeraceae bacterium]
MKHSHLSPVWLACFLLLMPINICFGDAPTSKDGPAAADQSSATTVAEPQADQATAEQEPEPERVELTQKQRNICEQLGIDADLLTSLINKPLYEFSEAEVDTYLRYLNAFEPKLRDRVRHLARKNIGQPYEIYLLGEMPFEHYDPQPLYCLTKSDCLVFCEHTYAMALSSNWEQFIRMLQRIRYANGRIGVATRNHFTESDWNISNAWLVRDITAELARQRGVRFVQKVDRARFLRTRYGLETDIPVQEHEDVYLPFEYIDQAKPRLRDGDFVNIVRGRPAKDDEKKNESPEGKEMKNVFGGSAWVGHTGMIVLGDDGQVHLIHSAKPCVREEPIDEYIRAATENLDERDAAGKPRLLGFKFLRLHNDPIGNLRRLDGPQAPRVTLPESGLLR